MITQMLKKFWFSLLLHDLVLYPVKFIYCFFFLFVFGLTGLRFTVPPLVTVFICASCWLSQEQPSLPVPLVMWRLLQISAKKWKRATSSAPSFYMVRNNPPVIQG